MSPGLDVASALARGVDAVRTIETYVAASHAVGNSSALTAAEIRDLYTAESGLRLDALDADSKALIDLAETAEEGIRLEAGVRDTVRQAWRGISGSAAADFIDRHLADGSVAVAALRDAAAALAALRDELATLVDQKVKAATDFNGRWSAAHSVWRAEAEAVLNGIADDVAVAVVRRQISPHVHGDVQSDWIPAMRDATDSVAGAYDGTIARLSDRPLPPQYDGAQYDGAQYDGAQFSGTASGPLTDTASAPPSPAAPQWGSAAAPQWGSAAAPQWGSAAAPQWGSAAAPQWPQAAAGLPSGFSDLGRMGALGGMGGLAGGLPDLISRIAETLGPYAGPEDQAHWPGRDADREHRRAKESVPEPIPVEPRERDIAVGDLPSDAGLAEPDGQPTLTPVESKPVGGAPVPPPMPAQPATPPVSAPPAERAGPPLTAAVPAAAEPPRPEPPPLAAEVGAPVIAPKPPRPAVGSDAESASGMAKTPCAIAADELPQVGQ